LNGNGIPMSSLAFFENFRIIPITSSAISTYAKINERLPAAATGLNDYGGGGALVLSSDDEWDEVIRGGGGVVYVSDSDCD